MKKNEFISYCMEFYGPGGLYAEFFNGGVSVLEVEDALKIRMKYKVPFHGDTTDRELIRDIMRVNRVIESSEYSNSMKKCFNV